MVAAYPDDSTRPLYAESLMDLSPWDYYMSDGPRNRDCDRNRAPTASKRPIHNIPVRCTSTFVCGSNAYAMRQGRR